jgi:hypothetical protein
LDGIKSWLSVLEGNELLLSRPGNWELVLDWKRLRPLKIRRKMPPKLSKAFLVAVLWRLIRAAKRFDVKMYFEVTGKPEHKVSSRETFLCRL